MAVTHTMGSQQKFARYTNWLQSGDPSVECTSLSYVLGNLASLESADALVLTGGHDVDPGLYGGDVGHPALVERDLRRDDFELQALAHALTLGMPVLGICRGLQLANVHFGGSLIIDIETAGYPTHRRIGDREGMHDISIEQNSLLRLKTSSERAEVNSSHHQAVLEPGSGLKVTARATDGIIEALELDQSPKNQFFLLVQWHPERMADKNSPISQGILYGLISAMKEYKYSRRAKAGRFYTTNSLS